MFDSGVGGLAVLAEVRRLLPGEDIIYYADSAHFPYGSRPPDEVRARSEAVSRELLGRGAKLIVVACNTATSAAIAHLRERLDVPFVGMEPALKPAAERTQSGTVALLVTPGTARGEKLASLIDRHGRDVAACRSSKPPASPSASSAATSTAPRRRRSSDATPTKSAHRAPTCSPSAARTTPSSATPSTRELGAAVDVIEPSEAVARQVARVLDEQRPAERAHRRRKRRVRVQRR